MLKIYSVFDRVTGVFSGLFLFPNEGTVRRAISEAIASGDENFCAFSKDKCLYCLGIWDQESGQIDSRVEYIVEVANLRNTDPEAALNSLRSMEISHNEDSSQ